jgi:hypothetical protein
MDDDILKILSEELRETKKLVIQATRTADAAEKTAMAAEATAREAMGKADAAWEMVMITRNQVKEELDYLKKPLWKKWFGTE